MAPPPSVRGKRLAHSPWDRAVFSGSEVWGDAARVEVYEHGVLARLRWYIADGVTWIPWPSLHVDRLAIDERGERVWLKLSDPQHSVLFRMNAAHASYITLTIRDARRDSDLPPAPTPSR